MGWERFHASCRRHLRRPSEDFALTMAYFRSHRDAGLLGPPPRSSSLADSLMQGMARMPADARAIALQRYATLDLDDLLKPPPGLARVSLYLLLLSAMLVLMVSVFSLFVLPSLQSFYADAGHVLPEFSQQVMRWAPALAVGVPLLAGYVLASALALRGLLPSAESRVSAGRLDWLLPSALRAQGARVRALVASPVIGVDDVALKHELAAMESEGVLLSEELPAILRLQSHGLQRLAERFSVGLLLLLSLAVVASIATFLVAIYLPIFRMGSTL